MAFRTIMHKGRTIYYMDFRGCDPHQMIAIVDKMHELVNSFPQQVLILANYTGTTATTEFMNRIKEAGKHGVATGKHRKSAVIGITGLKAILLQGYLSATNDKNTKAFDTEEDALDWLVSDK